MDRMLLDLNLPPPSCWSPQAVHILSPSSEKRPSSPGNVAPNDSAVTSNLGGESNVEVLDAPAPQLEGENCSSLDDESSCIVQSPLKPQESEVRQRTNDAHLEASEPTGAVTSEGRQEVVGTSESGPVAIYEIGNGIGLKPRHHRDTATELEKNSQTLQRLGSASVEANGSNPSEEGTAEQGGPVKVHKRLRTLGQLRSRKEEKNVIDALLEDANLEDEIGSEPGGKGSYEVEDSPVPVRAGRFSSHFRSKRGDKSALILASNDDTDSKKEVSTGDGASKSDYGSGKLLKVNIPGPGRFSIKIPSQPRSRKPEKRSSIVTPSSIVASASKPEDRTMKTELSEGSGAGSSKTPRALDAVRSLEEVVPTEGGKPDSGKDLPNVTTENVPASGSGLKRPGGSIKDAMPGKKRRQTVLLEVDESLKQARPLRTPTGEGALSRNSRFRRESPRLPPPQLLEKQEISCGDAGTSSSQAAPCRKLEEFSEEASQTERSLKPTGDGPGHFRRPVLKKQQSATYSREDTAGRIVPSNQANDLAKMFDLPDSRNTPGGGESLGSQKPRRTPRKPETKKQSAVTVQDASIERLHREATCSKLWQTSGTSDLQQVPGNFESVEDYMRVLEPLLFEECRAQLHSSWEELLEGSVKDAHVPISIKGIERRERGWYDVVVLPEDPHLKLKFKEGDVAVISTPKPGSGGRLKGRSKGVAGKDKEDGVVSGRLTGIVRRYYPIDSRDPPGAVLHFHVSQDDADDVSGRDPSTVNGNVIKELNRPGLTWFLTVLGSVTTTQREYVALHFLQQFHPKMLNAILQPRPELFPGYADQEPPAMPECFTPAFVEHLHGHFNGPQLAAIQWAGAHTAAGSGSTATSGTPKQEPWPFTLVQGPPGTGKTHTVWGMLNVIHLVQYQRYYQALLKKLAPHSLASEEPSTSTHGSFENGSIDDVLQRMDDSLARMLPKLCPKPRMLVCAPSNAATDELLSRVLDRGFIDGEMKVYRPDVARVGSDPHSRAAQAVSVERRSEQLLTMGRDQVVGWLQQLKGKEMNCSQIITGLQRDLNEVATATRTQGNVGVDPDKLAARDQARDSKLQQLAALVEERDKILVEMSRLFIVEGRWRLGNGFSQDDARQKLEASFANEAEIVFTTVSSSGRRIFTKLAHGFDMVVIDEAAQASEVAVLPPLSLRAARCVLVGDPQQLPATVISRVADTMQYSRSLFERFQQAGCPAILLSVQYRMHPQIRDFPSRYFYQGRLVDSESVKSRPDEVYHKDLLLKPYLFYDISHGRESHGGSVSYQNKLEAQVAVRLYLHLQEVVAAGGTPSVSVGMITPYKQQLRCLQSEFEAAVGANAESKGVYINTVDAFQGQERDVIMMSCVRASTHGVGFVADIRRMNVALTRARRSLWVIGNATALLQSEDWSALLADAKTRGCFVETSTSTARGLLTEPPGVLIPSQAGPGLLRHAPSSHPNLSFNNFTHTGFGRGRQQDGIMQHGNESEQRGLWQGSGHRGGRGGYRDSSRGGFSQRGLPLNRSYGRGTNMSYRRGKGL